MLLWTSNNQQFLFSDPNKQTHLLRIVGEDNMKRFEELGMADTDLPREVMSMLQERIEQSGGMSDEELRMITKELEVPKKAVILNPNEKDPMKYNVKPKFEKEEGGEYGKLYVTPEDMMDVTFDYIPDVKSMQLGEGETQANSRMRLLTILTNPGIEEKLAKEGKTLKISELVVKIMQDMGESNPQKFIEGINGPTNPNAATMGNIGAQGIPGNVATPGPVSGGAIPQPQGQEIQPQPF
jgi:hypothetical protein